MYVFGKTAQPFLRIIHSYTVMTLRSWITLVAYTLINVQDESFQHSSIIILKVVLPGWHGEEKNFLKDQIWYSLL